MMGWLGRRCQLGRWERPAPKSRTVLGDFLRMVLKAPGRLLK